MTMKAQRWHKLVRLPLAAAVAATVAGPVSAFQFYIGDVEASFDTTLTAGASWRVQERDKDLLAQGNLAPIGNNPFATNTGAGYYSTIGSSTNNYDDGNWNFDKGDAYSQIVKGTSELLVRYESVGAFVRGKYWYDFVIEDEKFARDGTGAVHGMSQDGLDNGSGVDLLDAYVWWDTEIAEHPANIRVGRQVVSWGESTFIRGGINVINPVNAGAIRAPGAEVKEALLPVNMVYGSFGITENLTLEAFYQLEWEKTQIDDCGSFFSTADFVADGCGDVYLAGQFPDWYVRDVLGGAATAYRVGDVEPDDAGQFGIALRWYAAELNDTEFGFFFINNHSQVPMISGVVSTDPVAGDRPEYFIEFPEDIKTYGISFNTSTESGWSIGGEISYKQDVPLQWNSFELIFGGAGAYCTNGAAECLDPSLFSGVGGASKLYLRELAKVNGNHAALYGQTLEGWDPYDVAQAQLTFIKFYDQVFGASRLTFVGEVGVTKVMDLPSLDEARYGRSGNYGIGVLPGGSCEAILNINSTFCTDKGYTTRASWGYRTRFVLDYNDVFAGVNLSPTIAWSHDVSGNAPEPGGNFVEGAKALGLSLKAVYLNQYSATIGYTTFFGGEYNVVNDRDNVSLSVSYSF